MKPKFSEDVVPLLDLKEDPNKIINRAKDTRRPVLLTGSRGEGIAVVQGLYEYEQMAEENKFIKAIAQGLLDIREEKQIELTEVKNKLGLS